MTTPTLAFLEAAAEPTGAAMDAWLHAGLPNWTPQQVAADALRMRHALVHIARGGDRLRLQAIAQDVPRATTTTAGAKS